MLTATLAYFCIFLLLFFLILYLPGFLLLSIVRKDLTVLETIALSLSLGIVLFVALGIFLGIADLRQLLLPALGILGLISLSRFRKTIFPRLGLLKTNKLLLTILLLGILAQGFISFPSGLRYKDGLLFWSSQGFDGFWHISIMEEIKKEFPPQIPVFSGEKLVNYHYLSDILMGEFLRIFPFFNPLDLYFRFFPVIFSFLMGVCTFCFVKRWQNTRVALWALFFTYFTGSFGYIVTFFRNGQILGGETAFWVSQLNTVVANPPHAVAISLLLSFLLSFLIYLKNRKPLWFAISFLTVFMVAGFKVSSGVVLLSGVAAAFIIDFIVTRNLLIFYLLILLGISNFVTIKLMTKGVEGYLIFQPWWFVRTMIVAKLGWMDMEFKRQHYLSKGTWHAYLRVLQLETTAFAVFLAGNLGTRIIGFVDILNKAFLKRIILRNPFEISIFVMMLTAFLVPMFFLQKGIVYNSIQFMQYFLLFMGFYAAITTTHIVQFLKNRLLKIIFILVVIILSIPTVIGNLVEFYGPNTSPLAKISNEELEALSYLKSHSNKDDVILSPVFDKYLKDRYKLQPVPIYAWYSTGYVSGLTGRRTYLTSEDMVIQTGFDFDGRKEEVNNFFDSKDKDVSKDFLEAKNIRFLYIPKVQLKPSLKLDSLRKIFENSEIVIYGVD